MASFMLAVASSLVASVVVVVIGWFGSTAARNLMVTLLSRVTGTGIARVYKTQKLANKDLPRDLRQARWLKVLAGRGNEMTRGSFARFWTENAAQRMDSVRVLLPDPEGKWVARREAEVMRHDSGFGDGLLADQVRGNLQYLQTQTASTDLIELATCDVPQVCRIIATDRVVYMTPYSDREHGRNSPCYVYSRGTPMYEFALRVFDSAWREAVSVTDSHNVN